MKFQSLYPAAYIVLFFALLFAVLRMTSPFQVSLASVNTNKTDTFSVTGEGKVTVAPDEAVVQAGVNATGPTVKEVQTTMNTNSNAIIAAIGKVGIAKEDIKTTNYSLSPTYDYRDGKQRVTGYQASSMVMIHIRDIEKVNAVLDAASTSGANLIGGVSFDIADKTKSQNDAREKAVTEAKRKAEMAAKTAGFKLGRVINYTENFNGSPIAMPMLSKTGMMDAERTISADIQPGTNDVRILVSLSYEIL